MIAAMIYDVKTFGPMRECSFIWLVMLRRAARLRRWRPRLLGHALPFFASRATPCQSLSVSLPQALSDARSEFTRIFASRKRHDVVKMI